MRSLHRNRVSRSAFLGIALTLGFGGVAKADTFSPGAFITYPQLLWSHSFPGYGDTLLLNDFSSVYASSGSTVTVGSNAGFNMVFDSAFTISFQYLPAVGTPGILTQSLIDPTSTPAGQFGADVLALELNVDFSDAGFLRGSAGIPFGDLVLTNLSATPALNGLTVRQFLGDANQCLGAVICIYSPAVLDGVAADINASFPPVQRLRAEQPYAAGS